ncbi:BspA family leucine-rich repeat surface protein [Mycoplasmopsis bovis]
MTPSNSHGDQSKDDSSNVDKTTDAKNNNEKSESTVTPKDQSDESRSEAGKNDNVNTIPMNNDEEEKKLKDKQEQDPVLQKVLGTWNKDFKNDIWANWSYKDIFEKLKSKIPDINLQLVSDPGIKPKPNSDSTNPPFVIKLNDSSNEQVLPFGKVWPISYETQYEGDVATTIGYDDKGKIKKFRSSTNKVPEHLPKFISSLESAFAGSTQEKIENLDKWDTSNISDFNTVFNDANKFNHDISRWKTDSAASMVEMFSGATNFDQNISNWNTSNVTDMEGMFWEATNFNQDLNSWNVEKVTSMRNMFSGTKNFNSNLDNWKPKSIETVNGMFANSNFNKSLKPWESHLPTGNFNAEQFKKDDDKLDDNNLPEKILRLLNEYRKKVKASNIK